MKRRIRRPFELRKSCDCADRNRCFHHWRLRTKVGDERKRLDLTEHYKLALPMTREDAMVYAAKARDALRRGGLAPASTPRTFADIADKYKAAFPTRAHHYVDALKTALGSMPADDVTAADIKAMVRTWRARKRTKAGRQGGAVAERHLLQTARHLYNWSIAEGYARVTPFKTSQGVNLIKVKSTRSRNRRLEAGEAERILAVADDYIRDFFTAMIEVGTRPGELRTLQWKDVHANHLVLAASKTKDRESRRLPIMPALREILDRRKVAPDGAEFGPEHYVFGDAFGRELKKRRLCQRWLDTCRAAGIDNLHMHDLRAEAGSQLLEAGVAIHAVRDVLGHSSTSTTNTYLRTRQRTVDDAFATRQRAQLRRAK